jgi:hypothetical protein
MQKIKKLLQILLSFGVDVRIMYYSFIALFCYLKNYVFFLYQYYNHNIPFKISFFPQLADKYLQSGTASGHYFHQDLWASRLVYSRMPESHIDVGSRIDGFVSNILTFMNINVIDIRPLDSKVRGLNFVKFDMLKSQGTKLTSPSVSCLHALEHFGLGRYGDPIDINGWKKGFSNLSSCVDKGGYLYLSVPISDKQRVEFNAHRVFEPKTIVDHASISGLSLMSFSYIDDCGNFNENTDLCLEKCHYGCGCFEFLKA